MSAKTKAGSCWWVVLLLSAASVNAGGRDQRLVEAVAKRDRQMARSLIQQHADVNVPQSDGATALHWAAHWDDLETADLLIHAGADVNATTGYGLTPLTPACTNGSTAMVEKLLKAGADPNAGQSIGATTALMVCARNGSVEAVQLLLAHGADVNASAEEQQGRTALMWAVAKKHPEVVRVLLEHGSNAHARSKGGFTPFLLAAQQGDVDSARLLLAAGADVNEPTPESGNALVVASASGHEALSIFLLEKGADANAVDRNGLTALHYAVQKGISAITAVEFQPHAANLVRPNMRELVKVLLARGANPNTRILRFPPHRLSSLPGQIPVSLVGATPFFLAASAADVTIMRALLAAGADPQLGTEGNGRTGADYEGSATPLMVAAGMGRSQDRSEEEERSALEAVKLLVQVGAAVNAANEMGQTALHAAAFIGGDATIQFLAANGATVAVKNRLGQTPLSIAEGIPPEDAKSLVRTVKHNSTADLIRKLGGDISSR